MEEHGDFMYISTFLSQIHELQLLVLLNILFLFTESSPTLYKNTIESRTIPVSFPQSPKRPFLTVNCSKSLFLCVSFYWRTTAIMKISTSRFTEKENGLLYCIIYIMGFATIMLYISILSNFITKRNRLNILSN